MPWVSYSTPMRLPSRSISLRRFFRSIVGSALMRSTQISMRSILEVWRAWRRSAERVRSTIEPSFLTTRVWKKQ
ncbi:hypothetical protein D3C87_1687390 [compost metagenome]